MITDTPQVRRPKEIAYSQSFSGLTFPRTEWQHACTNLEETATHFRLAFVHLRLSILAFRILLTKRTSAAIRVFFGPLVTWVFRHKRVDMECSYKTAQSRKPFKAGRSR